MPPRLMHVDLDAFFVEVCRQRNPELRGVDLLVVGGRRDSRSVVQSASYGARKFGVRAGMPIARAVALCPAATFFAGEFAWYRDASQQVRAILEQFSPTVVMSGLDEGYLDFAGTERLYPVSLLPVAESIRTTVHQAAGLDASIGIGPNRMVAKLASDAAKPRGVVEVRAGWEEGFLAGLPLRAMPGVGPSTASRLATVGLVDVWQVQRLTEAQLAHLIGTDEARPLKLRAHGWGGSVLRGNRPARSVSRETTFGLDVRDPDELETMLLLFVTRLSAQLRDAHLMARTITLKLRHDDFTTVTRSATLREATDLDRDLFEAVRPLFHAAYQEVRQRNRGVRLIGVSATNLTQASAPDLFESPERERLRLLSRAVDRVRERFGDRAVGPAGILGLRKT